MSSPPIRRTLEGLIEDTWEFQPDQVRVVALWLEPYRADVESLLQDFDEDEQSWRDYQSCIFGGYSYEGVIPRDVLTSVDSFSRDTDFMEGLSAFGEGLQRIGQNWSTAHD